MIYVTGDFHGDIDRFSVRDIKRLKRKDYLIILGDFGFIWNGSKEEQKLLKWIGKRRFTTLFIEGTHDNYSLFENYPEVDFAGGRARHISGRLYKLTRGHIFNLDDKKIFAFGGGETIDKDVADEGKTWWQQEIPTEEECAEAMTRLESSACNVDYILTHDAPAIIRDFINLDLYSFNIIHRFFDFITKSCEFKKWYFGCYHLDKTVTQKYIGVFKDVQPLE